MTDAAALLLAACGLAAAAVLAHGLRDYGRLRRHGDEAIGDPRRGGAVARV